MSKPFRGRADRMREREGRKIANMAGMVERLDSGHYRVCTPKSGEWYDVTLDDCGWTCACPDHVIHLIRCIHICAIQALTGIMERAGRAEKIAENGHVRRIDARTYVVDSQTSEDVRYIVRRVGDNWVCPCPDYKHGGRHCKHMLSVHITLGTCTAVLQLMAAATCPRCGSKRLAKKHTLGSKKSRVQHYQCTCNQGRPSDAPSGGPP